MRREEKIRRVAGPKTTSCSSCLWQRGWKGKALYIYWYIYVCMYYVCVQIHTYIHGETTLVISQYTMRREGDTHTVPPLGVQSTGRTSRVIRATNFLSYKRGAELHTKEIFQLATHQRQATLSLHADILVWFWLGQTCLLVDPSRKDLSRFQAWGCLFLLCKGQRLLPLPSCLFLQPLHSRVCCPPAFASV